MIKMEYYVSQTSLTKITNIIEYLLLVVFFFFNIMIFIPTLTHNSIIRESVYNLFSFVCHQEKSLSFIINSHKLAVCSRCTGIYQGFFMGGIMFFMAFKKKIDKRTLKHFLLITVLIIMFSKIYQYYAINILTNLIRWLSGIFIGIIFSYSIYYKGEKNGAKQYQSRR